MSHAYTLKTTGPVRVFLLDDHEIVRRGVAGVLNAESDLEVVGDHGSAHGALAAVKACSPDVAVLDVRLGDGSGIEVCRDIRSAHPDIGCLMLTSFSDDEALLDAAMAGAAGYVLKQIRMNDLTESIRKVADGVQLLDKAEVRMRMRRLSETEEGVLRTLTPQELKIFELIGEGMSNRQIADEIFLAEKTVKNYASNLFSKLGIARRTQAAALAARVDERRKNRFE
jgi:DNA-binding NarL/FixJ family response regulator